MLLGSDPEEEWSLVVMPEEAPEELLPRNKRAASFFLEPNAWDPNLPLSVFTAETKGYELHEDGYALYIVLVRCSHLAWEVRHRFSEFTTLLDKLDQAGLLDLPEPPPKTPSFHGAFTHEFLSQRAHALSMFLWDLLNLTAVLDHALTRAFLKLDQTASMTLSRLNQQLETGEGTGVQCSQYFPPSQYQAEGFRTQSDPRLFTCYVSSAEVMDNSFARYRLIIQCCMFHWSMWRRFSDFDLLYELLAQNRDKKTLPNLPPKFVFRSLLHSLDKAYLEERQGELQIFVNRLLSLPELCLHKRVREFFNLDSLALRRPM